MIAIRTSKTQLRFSRRALLKGMGVSAAFVPLIDAEPALGANADGFVKRLVTITWTNGMPSSSFWPSSDTDPTSSTVLSALAPVASKVTVAAAVDCKIMLDLGHKYDGHFTFPVLWTGTYKNTGGQNATASGPSLDQVYSDYVAGTTNLPIPLLAISMVGGKGTTYRTGGTANTAQTDPTRLFSQSFTGLGGATAPATPGMPGANPQLRRQSVLDFVKDDLQTFTTRLGTVDQAKVAAHLESIRQLELQLTASATAGTGAGVAPGVVCKATSPASTTVFEAKLKSFLDLTAIALRCDLTRSVSMVWGADGGSGPGSWPALGIGDYHGLAHQGAAGYTNKSKIDGYYYSQVAYLAQALDATMESGGTALDHSVIGITNDMDEGSEHYVGRLPFVLVGSAGGALKTGRVVRLGAWAGKTGTYWKQDSGIAHNTMLATLAGALGVTGPSATSFGTGYPGTIPDLLA